MKELFRWLFTPFHSSPRRWFWVGMMLLVLVALALTGNLA
jgi:hypothetical protein